MADTRKITEKPDGKIYNSNNNNNNNNNNDNNNNNNNNIIKTLLEYFHYT